MGTRDIKNVLVGGARVFINRVEIGWLSTDEIKVTESATDLVVKESEGSTVKTIATDKTVNATFGLLEANLDMIRMMNPSYKRIVRGDSVVAVTSEFVEDLGNFSSLKHSHIDETIPIVINPATMLKLSCEAGETEIYVSNARRFATGDDIAIVRGLTVENLTIGTVDTISGKITVTTPLVNSFPGGVMVKNLESSKEMVLGTDYNIMPMNGTIMRVATSTDVLPGDSCSVDYSYHQFEESGIGAGAFTDSTTTYEVQIWHKKTKTEARYVKFFKSKLSGEFSPFGVKGDAETPIPVTLTALADETILDNSENTYTIMDAPISGAPNGGW